MANADAGKIKYAQSAYKYQLKQPKAPTGYTYVAVGQNAAGVVKWKLVKLSTSSPGSSGSSTSGSSTSGSSTSGSSTSGSSGGGSTSTKDKSDQYLQLYRTILDNRKATPPKGLIAKAVAGKWSSAYFQLYVRKTDPAWLKSPKGQQRLVEARQYWKALFPDRKVNANIAVRYARSTVNLNTFMRTTITKTAAFRKDYKYWTGFQTAQRKAGGKADPLLYLQYKQAFTRAYQQLGTAAPEGYERLFLRSGLTDEAFVENLQLVNQTRGAFAWAEGQQVTPTLEKQVLFSQKNAAQAAGRLKAAAVAQQEYFKSDLPGFQLGEENELITQRI